MRAATFVMALLASSISAAPIQTQHETSPVETSALLPRGNTCTNYPSHTPGTYIKKRDDLSPLESLSPSLLPRSSEIKWCRQSSDMWLSFPAPGGDISSQATFGSEFALVLNNLRTIIREGHGGSELVAGRAEWLGTTNGLSMYAERKSHMNWAQTMTAVEIMQNYVYVAKEYAALNARVMEGEWELGTLYFT